MWAVAGVAIGSGLMDLLAIAQNRTKARYLWKPLTILLIIFAALLNADFSNPWAWWLVIGLVLSMAGDVFLVLPSDRFIAGLVSFLAAHLCYIAAFALQSESATSNALAEYGIPIAIALAAFGLIMFRLLFRGVLTSDGPGLLVAVACYMTVILAMVWWAAMSGSALVLAGAVLFMISDCILAWGRFIKSSLPGELSVMVTYYAAQLLLAFTL